MHYVISDYIILKYKKKNELTKNNKNNNTQNPASFPAHLAGVRSSPRSRAAAGTCTAAPAARPPPPTAQRPLSPPAAMRRERTAGPGTTGRARPASPSLRRRGPEGGRGSPPGEALPYLLPEVDGDVGDAERDEEPDEGPVVSERWKFHHSPSCTVTPSASAAAGDGAGGRRGGKDERAKEEGACVSLCVCASWSGGGGKQGRGRGAAGPPKNKAAGGAGGCPVPPCPARLGPGGCWLGGGARCAAALAGDPRDQVHPHRPPPTQQ